MKTILLICSDEEYNNNIECKLAMQLQGDVLLHIITDEEKLKKVISTPSEVSTILVETRFVEVLGNSIKAGEIFELDDKVSDLPDGHISKYAGIQAILRVLDKKLLKHEGEVIDRDARIVDVVSVCGGSGKTLSALGLSKRLSMMGRKVLYVNTQALQDYYPFLDGEKEYMSDALVRQMSYITESTTDMVISEIKHDSFDYMPQMENLTTKMQVSESAYHEIITNLSKRYLYDYIVVEHGCNFGGDTLRWLSRSERTLVVTRQDKISVDRTERFLSQLNGMKGQCAILCGRFDKEKTDFLKDSDLGNKYPVCECVGEIEGAHLDDFIESGCFSQSAEAML